MPKGMKVDLAALRTAQGEVDAAAVHYRALLAKCEAGLAELKLVGGYGKTGEYQDQLTEFDTQWRGTAQQFIEDERAFVTFLDRLREWMGQAHSLYVEIEQETTDSITAIGNRLDG